MKKKKQNYLSKLIMNNTGVSSKNFFLVIVTIIGCLLLLVPVFTLTIEAFYNHSISTSLDGYAAYIASVSAIFASAGITKIYGDKYEKDEHDYHEDNEDEYNENDIEKDDIN